MFYKFNKNSKIGVIGAGPSGVHMAYQLKKLGYDNINILEATNRVGGKSYTLKNHGMYIEQGTSWAVIGDPVLDKFFKELNIECKPDAKMSVLDEGKILQVLDYGCIKYYKNQGHDNPSPADCKKFGHQAMGDALKYFGIRKSYFKNTPIPKDYGSGAFDLSLTFKEFLDHHNISTLHYITNTLVAANAYESENYPISAYYGLMWISLSTLPNQLTKPPCFVVGGYQSVWEKAVQNQNIEVVFNCKVDYLSYLSDVNKVEVGCNNLGALYTYDFVINAAEFPIKYLKNPTTLQKEVLSQNVWSVAIIGNLVHSSDPTDFGANEYAVGNIKACLNSNSTQYKYPLCAIQYMNHVYNVTLPHKHEILGAFQYLMQPKRFGYNFNDQDINEARQQLFAQLKDDYKQENMHIVDHTTVWANYFPHFISEGIKNKLPWKLLNEVQAEGSIWFVGGSSTFELVPLVMRYNNYLLKISSTHPQEVVKYEHSAINTLYESWLELLGNDFDGIKEHLLVLRSQIEDLCHSSNDDYANECTKHLNEALDIIGQLLPSQQDTIVTDKVEL